MASKLKRYDSQTIALSDDEKQVIEILSFVTGIRKATLSRSLFYRGLADFLRDRQTEPDRPESEIYDELVKLTHSDHKMRAARQIIEGRSDNKKPKKVANSR